MNRIFNPILPALPRTIIVVVAIVNLGIGAPRSEARDCDCSTGGVLECDFLNEECKLGGCTRTLLGCGPAGTDGCDGLCKPKTALPTISVWGMMVTTLLLLTGIAIKFGRRRPAAA